MRFYASIPMISHKNQSVKLFKSKIEAFRSLSGQILLGIALYLYPRVL